MPHRLLAGALAVATLVPAAALAKSSDDAPPRPVKHSVIVFVSAEDRGAESSALKLGQLVEEAVARNDHATLTSLSEVAGDRIPADARSALHAAEDDLTNGKKAYGEAKLDDAVAALKSAVKGFEAAAAAMDKPDAYAEANAYLGAVYQLQHKDDDAKDAVGEALAVMPTFKPDAKLAGGPFADLFRAAKRESTEGHRGSASVFTTPSGGKVFIDGELKGYAPLSIDRIPVGRHLVRLERPGYMSFGQATDVTSTDEVAIKGHFTATKEFGDVEDQVGQAFKEMDSSSAGPATFKLLTKFNAERGIFAVVRTSGDNLTLELALDDLKARKRIGHKRNSFEGEDPNNLSREVSRMVSQVLSDADETPRASKSSSHKDPLDSISGEEDWDEDKPSSSKRHSGGSDDDEDQPKKKAKSSDDE